MSNKQVISYADLSIINKSLTSISSNIQHINSDIGSINFKQNHLESELQTLSDLVHNFIQTDLRQKALQLAETRQGNLKQDLQIKYGYYAEVRRMASGILQAVDTGVVSDDSIKFSTEEVMLKAPGYWLAPALVALSAWIRDDKETHQKALNEALKRDDHKTTLFFMLIMRRLQRGEASFKWLERYFMLQDPYNLDKEFIIILEAVTTGVFPPASRQLMTSSVNSWLEILTKEDDFVNKQKQRWVELFEGSGQLQKGKYPILKKFSPTWSSLSKSLKDVKAHEEIKTKFENIISLGADFSKSTTVQLDEILTLLVTHFDDEELPLQQKVRLNELIIELEGDKAGAQALMDSEMSIFTEHVNFLQLLTNAAFNPELSGATKTTQALAVSICQPWILQAHDTFTAKSRNRIPQTIDFKIDDLEFTTTNGSNESVLLSEQDVYYQNILKRETSKLSYISTSSIFGLLLVLLGLPRLPGFVSFIILAIGGLLIFRKIRQYNKAKSEITEKVKERQNKAREVLRGCIAETVDYRKEHETEDAKAEKVRQLLNSITPEDFSSVSRETARNII